MVKRAYLLFFGTLGCDPNVVEVVREPVPLVDAGPESPLESSLIHRYSFSGDGAVALDSKFSAHGDIVGTVLAGTGSLKLAGSRGTEYVDLPDRIVSGLTDATFEAWLTWNGSGYWQRIFDFGSSAGGEDPPVNTTAAGTSYLFLTTNAENTRGAPGGLRVAYSQNGIDDEDVCGGTQPFPSGVPGHAAVVVDRNAMSIAVYQDGVLVNKCPFSRLLSDIDDNNNWLGRSNFVLDADLAARYDEFRIYRAALTAEQIADSFKLGPDAEP